MTGSLTNIPMRKLDDHGIFIKFCKMTHIPIRKLDKPGILMKLRNSSRIRRPQIWIDSIVICVMNFYGQVWGGTDKWRYYRSAR